MEVEDLYQTQINKLFAFHNPSPKTYHNLSYFLNEECKNEIENTKRFLTTLSAHRNILINFNAFCKIVRIIKKTVLSQRNQQLQYSLSNFVISHSALYFPYLSNIQQKQFNQLLSLFDDLAIERPQNMKDHRRVLIYLLKEKYSEEFAGRVAQIFNNEVLIDRKLQEAKFLKVNEFFSSFVVKHFDLLFPQLERLLIRSESNIEVWAQFITKIKNWKGIDGFVLILLTKVKQYFANYPEACVDIVVNLTSQLTDQKAIKEVLTFLSGLIGGQHNVKKKIVYIRMLLGLISSLKAYPDETARSIYSQEILVVIANSLIKFTEEEEFLILINVIDQVIPLVVKPKDDIAKTLKIYLKNQNKYILILLGVIMSGVYGKQEIDSLPSVKQVFNHFKAQLPTIIKKIESNWQWLMPIVAFLSQSDLSYVDYLNGDLPLFKVSCLALTKPQMKIGLKLIQTKISYEQGQQQEIESYLYVIAILLLQQIKDQKLWKIFTTQLGLKNRINLVTKGLFPLLIFECNQLKKNKGNQFRSLQLFLKNSFKNQKILLEEELDLAKFIYSFRNVRNSFIKNVATEKNAQLELLIQHYVKSSLLQVDNEEEIIISSKDKKIIDSISQSLLVYNQNYIVQLFVPFTNEEYYKKNLDFLIKFQEDQHASLKIVKEQLADFRQILVQKQIHKLQQEKPRKIYIGMNFEVKMMSEQEVKEEKYRKHFLKMASLFDKIVLLFLNTLRDHNLLNKLWQANLKNILFITKYPEHRLSILKLIKRSCIFTAWQNKKYVESKIFVKHSLFLGQFFSFKNSGITPSIKMMAHSQSFLKELIELPFQEQKDKYHMLQNIQDSFVMLFVNQMCQALLENMEFDLHLKKLSITFYDKCIKKGLSFNNQDILFTHIVNNINILTNSQHIQNFLLYLLKKVDQIRVKELFQDILNFIQSTKKLILHTLTLLENKYKPQFQEFIKLRILALQFNQEISKLATELLTSDVDLKNSILTFNMKNFVKKNSKQTIQKLCLFIKQQLTAENSQAIFKMVLKASQELFNQGFDQQGLQMLPFFLNINIQYINENLFRPVFQVLITKFSSKEQFATLNKLSVQAGIDIIKRNAKQHAEKLLLVLQSFINKSSGVSNIIFLGVLAPYLEGNKNLQIIQKRITELFNSNKENDQRAISKCIPDLMSFFKKPKEIIDHIFNTISSMKDQQQIGQAYLFSGLLKGIGYKETLEYLDKILASTYVTKIRAQKNGRIQLLNALIQNFGRVIQVKSIKIIETILGYMADNAQDIRNLAKKVGQNLILKMSSFSVKILLPQLLKGLEQEQNWRVKISYIWILGVMANSSARQLQTSLPIIVPSLSSCLSNAHPTIREKASQALNLIGQTIKNPEISQCVDILIEALENPFEKSEKAIDILLKTSFNHYIDPPSLSMIIPILDYCLRGRSSDLKAGACQVMGSIVELISNPYDLLPYLQIIITGLRIAICDPLQEIRRISSMAIGRISTKIGIKSAQQYFKFVLEIIQSATSNTTQRQGAAQAYAEIICSHTFEYFEQSLYKIFDKLNSVKHSQKQGYILVFLYVPMIRTQQFEGFIKEVNENMYCFVSDQDQSIRNSAMLVEKVLINNYCLSHTDLLLEPLCDGIFQTNWKKRNAAIILIGQILNIIKGYMYRQRTNDKAYAYYRGIMAVYIIKDDDLEMTRQTANQVWNTYIQNTPKTIKIGLQELVKMWTKWTHSAGGVVFKNIVAFSSKYGENYFTQILEYLPNYLKEPEHQVGVFQVLAEFVKRLNSQFLSKEFYRTAIKKIFSEYLFVISENVRPSLAKCLALYVEKMKEQRFFEDLLCPTIQKMDHTDESNPEYTYNLHLLKDLLNTNSNSVVDRVINKVMETPMSQFKIQVITNNAERLANYLYTHFKKPATEVLVEQIYLLVGNKQKENRLSLIIYCLQQVSLQLSKKNKAQFIRMVNLNISKGITLYSENKTDYNHKVLQTFINMLLFFLNSTLLSQIEDLDIIIGQISPLVFLGDKKLSSLGHKIYLLVISDSKSFRTSGYIRQMVVSFQNKLTTKDQIIWDDQATLKDYINILIKGIAYGKQQVMEQSLDMVQFLIKHTPRNFIEQQIVKIVGPIVRIANYPLFLKQKVRIMQLLIEILKQKFRIDAFNNQILSVTLRLHQQFKNSQDIISVVADIYFYLLNVTVLKQEFILNIMGKLKGYDANLIQSFYILIKNIVNEGIQLPKTLFQKIYDEITTILMSNQGKLSVKGLYYASKIVGRLGVVLGKPIQKIQNQLRGLTIPYEIILNFLHFVYYKKVRLNRMQAIEVFLKESNRQKVYYLLKSIKLCIKNSQQAKAQYTREYVLKFVPETLIGFDDISDVLEQFESEFKEEEQVQAEINET